MSTGGLDNSFSEPSANGPVFTVAATSAGYIWMGGYFNSVNGSAHASESYASLSDTYYCLAVLNTNGTLDTNFTFANFTNLMSTVNFAGYYYVSAIAVDKSQDVVYTAFSNKGGSGTAPAFIARFDPVPFQPGHWTLNPTFTQTSLGHIQGIIHSLAFGNNTLYVAANVSDTGTTPAYNSTLGKFSADGTLDNAYTLAAGWGANNSLNAIFQVRYYPAGSVVEPGGTVVSWPSSLLLSGIAGVGTPDIGPYPLINNVPIACADMRNGTDRVFCPASGEILSGGAGTPYENSLPTPQYTGFEMHRFGGALQTPAISTVTNSPNDQGQSLTWIEALPGGGALVAGKFTKIHGSSVNNFAHLLPDGTVDPTFDNNTGFGWVLGMAQEPDGKYLLCGEGTYTAPIFGEVWGSVERRELLPTNQVAFVSQPQPANQVVYAGDNAYFSANVTSWPGLAAQWTRAGTDVTGQNTVALGLYNVTTNDSGTYQLSVQNEALCPATAVSSNVTLTVLPAPPAPANDLFANAIPLSGTFTLGLGTIRSATFETGETDPSGDYAGRSVWWTWTAPFSGTASVDVSGCDFPAAIGIFTGNDVSSLNVVTNNYDYGINCECTGLLTDFNFEVTAGTTYRIAIGGAPPTGSLGSVVFSLGQPQLSWSQNISPTTNSLYGITTSDNRLVAVGDGNTIVTSTDGTNWSATTTVGSGSYLNAVTFGEGFFVAAGDNGMILTSSDGTDWAEHPSGTTNAFWGVAYGNGTFVAADDSGAIVSSPDGIHWAEQASGLIPWFDGVTFFNGQFVAVGDRAGICTSPDGTNWTVHASPVRAELWGITGGGGQFVAVGENGNIVTSPDGTNWTAQAPPVYGTGVTLYNVSYGNGRFLTVGDNGTILLSPDGTNWIADAAGVNTNLYAVSYYQDGSFVLAGSGGVILINAPPRLGAINRFAGDHLEFNLTGLNGSTAIIESTPTLSPPAWQRMATNFINHGIVIFTDSMTNRSLYYRARIQ